MESYAEWWTACDTLAGALLLPLAVWILFSGIDDLFVDIVAWLARRLSRVRHPAPRRRELMRLPQARVAVCVPCWQEHAVIASMVERNLERIDYDAYDIFVGAYPNDTRTVDAVNELARRYGRVHLALCPHAGPTSKADCLNWIYQHVLLHESKHSVRYDILVTHDAEDVVDAHELRWINFHARTFAMVQIPVMPVATGLWRWTHGVYCDEFAEYQSRDMPARQFLGAFVPSSGVGTGFRRDALERLAEAEQNRIFEPVSLTEDYECGLRLRRLGARQWFHDLVPGGVATREYFPQTWRRAVRQRTRWVMGIALQTWDRHGWGGAAMQKYWLWRDRKGLIGNPASLLTNLLLLYYTAAALFRPWPALPGADTGLYWVTAVLGVYRLGYRAFWSGRHYGLIFACALPLRAVWANFINTAATFGALRQFARSKWTGEPLRWVKTEHEYPSAAALATNRWRIGEVLVRNGYLSAADLRAALADKPAGVRTGEWLVARGLIDEESLYDALSLQHSVPFRKLDPGEIRKEVARALPGKVCRRWRVVPFKVEAGALFVAGPEVPDSEIRAGLRPYTRLGLRFHLVPEGNYEELVSALL